MVLKKVQNQTKNHIIIKFLKHKMKSKIYTNNLKKQWNNIKHIIVKILKKKNRMNRMKVE